MCTGAAAKSLQSCPTLCDPIDSGPPGSPVPGILQARTLDWVAISFSNAWKWKVKVKALSRVQPSATPWIAAYQAPPSIGFSRQKYWSGVPLSPLNNSMRQMLLSSHSTDEPNRVQWIKYFDQDQWEMAQPRDSKACWRWKSFLFVPVSGPYCLYISCLTEQRLTLILGSMANIPSSH